MSASSQGPIRESLLAFLYALQGGAVDQLEASGWLAANAPEFFDSQSLVEQGIAGDLYAALSESLDARAPYPLRSMAAGILHRLGFTLEVQNGPVDAGPPNSSGTSVYRPIIGRILVGTR